LCTGTIPMAIINGVRLGGFLLGRRGIVADPRDCETE
jgi:hypothetical protein